MSIPIAQFADGICRLHEGVQCLHAEAERAGVAPLAGREWYELLGDKLRPQLSDDAYLVVAVVGGTNIGKSVVFNHLAGISASAVSPLASGTKHPVCLMPEGFSETHDLSVVFPGFELHEWSAAEAALEETDAHRLFWRASGAVPPNLLVLDTPDIDSDARVNWERADHIRRCADVLIAVLTQQKYNDAAVKEFFRTAAAEDKAVLIVFNQCQLPDDEQYWPRWVDTFCGETGIAPEWVYLAPFDRRAAESGQLPFLERPWPVDEEPQSDSDTDKVHNLLEDLSRLRFDEVKVRSLRGAIQHVVQVGIPDFLEEVRDASGEYLRAAELLSAHELAEIDNWPLVPNPLLIAEIRNWWAGQRHGWSATVHGFYNKLGQGITWPVRIARNRLTGGAPEPWEQYREREWHATLDAVEKVYTKLTWLSELGSDVLRPRLEAILQGTRRAELIEQIRTAHDQVELQAELQALVADELAAFRDESPNHYEFFRRLDMAAAAARPATSVVLFVTGFAPVGHAIAPVVTDTALQGVVHFAGDVAGGTITAAVGDAVISEGAASSAGYLEAKFRRLHSTFTARRAGWLAGLLNEHLLGSLPGEIQHAASLPESEVFQDVERSTTKLIELLNADDSPSGESRPRANSDSPMAIDGHS